MDRTVLFQTYSHFFWTEKLIQQLNDKHPELIAFQKRIPGFYDSIRSRAEESFLLFQQNVDEGNILSDCIDQSYQLMGRGFHVSLYHLLQDIVYKHSHKEATTENLVALCAFIRQYTGLEIEDGFPETLELKKLFVLAVESATLPVAELEQKLLVWEQSDRSIQKLLHYLPLE
jgi:hypothetical protein